MKRMLYVAVIIAAVMGCDKDDAGDEGRIIDGWTIKVIDEVSAGNGEITAARDGNNKLHVVYTDFGETIKYATNKSGSWVKTTLVTEAGLLMIGGDHGIAVDGNNHVHIVYATETNEMPGETTIYYATDQSGSLVSEVLYSAEGSMSGMDIAATADGHVHIVFGNEDFYLIYKNNLSGSWATATIDSYWTSAEPSLALDSDENLYVAYYHGWDGILKLQVINSSGALVSNTTLDNTGDAGWSPSMCINKSDNSKYIVYWDYDIEKSKLYNNGTIEQIETSTWSKGGIAIDNSGYPHMTYNVGNTFKHAIRNSEGFTIETLPDEIANDPSDIVIESTGKINIIYPSRTTWNLCVMSK